MILLGRGLNTLGPTRRLLFDAVGLLVTLSVLVCMAMALGYDSSFAASYISIFIAVQVLLVVIRYIRARRR